MQCLQQSRYRCSENIYQSFVSYALYSELLCILAEFKLNLAFLSTVRSDAVLQIIQSCKFAHNDQI